MTERKEEKEEERGKEGGDTGYYMHDPDPSDRLITIHYDTLQSGMSSKGLV